MLYKFTIIKCNSTTQHTLFLTSFHKINIHIATHCFNMLHLLIGPILCHLIIFNFFLFTVTFVVFIVAAIQRVMVVDINGVIQDRIWVVWWMILEFLGGTLAPTNYSELDWRIEGFGSTILFTKISLHCIALYYVIVLHLHHP